MQCRLYGFRVGASRPLCVHPVAHARRSALGRAALVDEEQLASTVLRARGAGGKRLGGEVLQGVEELRRCVRGPVAKLEWTDLWIGDTPAAQMPAALDASGGQVRSAWMQSEPSRHRGVGGALAAYAAWQEVIAVRKWARYLSRRGGGVNMRVACEATLAPRAVGRALQLTRRLSVGAQAAAEQDAATVGSWLDSLITWVERDAARGAAAYRGLLGGLLRRSEAATRASEGECRCCAAFGGPQRRREQSRGGYPELHLRGTICLAPRCARRDERRRGRSAERNALMRVAAGRRRQCAGAESSVRLVYRW